MLRLNGHLLNFTQFPNGETHVNGQEIASIIIGTTKKHYELEFTYESDMDLIRLLMVKKHLDLAIDKKIALVVRYMPYSRMDRVEGHSVFTLKYVSEFINDMNFDTVIIHEPHSDVTPALINRSQSAFPTKFHLPTVLHKINFDKNNDYLFFPDAGAQKRYHDVLGYKQVVGHKHRDFETGDIKGLEVVGAMEKGKKVLIVDDLCSKGGTFFHSAKALKELGAGEIYLFVAHCEKSIYEGDLLDSGLVEKVFATNSMQEESGHERLEILKVF